MHGRRACVLRVDRSNQIEVTAGHLGEALDEPPESHFQRTTFTEADLLIKQLDLFRCQPPARGTTVFDDMLDGVRFNDRNYSGLASAPVQSYLRSCLSSFRGDLSQNITGIIVLNGREVLT